MSGLLQDLRGIPGRIRRRGGHLRRVWGGDILNTQEIADRLDARRAAERSRHWDAQLEDYLWSLKNMGLRVTVWGESGTTALAWGYIKGWEVGISVALSKRPGGIAAYVPWADIYGISIQG